MPETEAVDTVVEKQPDPEVTPVEVVEELKKHPLEPGGERFEQVYARMKKAEEARTAEREARLVAEAKLDTLKEAKLTTPAQAKTFTWVELEQMIEDGKITRAAALDYREQQISRETEARVTQKLAEHAQVADRTKTVMGALNRYIAAEPDLKDLGSALRRKVEAEYSWLTSIHGEPVGESLDQRAMELTAVKNVLGSIEVLERKRQTDTDTRASRETHQDVSATNDRSSTRQDQGDEDTPPKGLTAAQVAHYEKMFQKSSAYPDRWISVRKELGWKKPPMLGKVGR